MPQTYILKIEFNCEPLIWRRISFPAHYNLYALHHALQNLFDWSDTSTHMFELIKFSRGLSPYYGLPNDPDGVFTYDLARNNILPMKLPSPKIKMDASPWNYRTDCRSVSLAAVLDKVGKAITYLYVSDWEDDWDVKITVEAINDEGPELPSVLDGELPAPPCQCSGVDSFTEALELYQEPREDWDEDDEEWLEENGLLDIWENDIPPPFSVAEADRSLQDCFRSSWEAEAWSDYPQN